jgi:hypothetical protein
MSQLGMDSLYLAGRGEDKVAFRSDLGQQAKAATHALSELIAREECRMARNAEYDGDLLDGSRAKHAYSALECCALCQEHAAQAAATGAGVQPCNIWVFCQEDDVRCYSHPNECWLKRARSPQWPSLRSEGPACGWTSGALYGELSDEAARRKATEAGADPLARYTEHCS